MPLPRDLLEAVAVLERAKKAGPRGLIPHKPTAKQQAFLAVTDLEALYGGAAGGGKSDALLMAALEYVHLPGYSALVLRRTYPDLALPGAIMDRARDWLANSGAAWNDKEKRWTFPSGSTLTFGYCDSERDRYRYQGAELQFLGVDELTQWPESWYRYLLSRLRRKEGSSLPLRARVASNPGGIGHHWVHRRFVDPDTAVGAYVPARLEDNPFLDQEAYRRSLAQLDAVTRAQLEQGEWIQDGGGLVYNYDPARNRVEQAPACHVFLLGIDFGVTDACGFTVLGWPKHDKTVYVLESHKQTGLDPTGAAEIVLSLQRQYEFSKIVGDQGGLGKAFVEEMRRRHAIPIEPSEKKNKRGYQSLLNGALERGEVKLVGPRCQDLIKELCELPWNEERTAESEGFENHACFPAGTMIQTPDGCVPIEDLGVGQLVETRAGPRSIVALACTGMRELWQVELSNGQTLLATADHPIFTAENGLVRLDSLLYGHTLLTWPEQRQLSGTGSPSDDFKSIGTASKSVARCRVRRTSRTGIVVPVYNLTVAERHEYFANGILVSNCDSLLYSWRAAWGYLEQPAAVKPGPDVDTYEQVLLDRARHKRQEQQIWGYDEDPFAH